MKSPSFATDLFWNRRAVLWIVLALPLIVLFALLYRFGWNIPFKDDFDLLEHFLTVNEFGWPEKATRLAQQHNEHRIVLARIFIELQAALFDEIDLRAWMWTGCLVFSITPWVLFRASAHLQRYPSLVFPVPFLIIAPFYHENIFWGMAALTNLPVLTLAFVSLWQIHEPGRIGVGFIAAIAATVTNGAGVFVWPAGLITLILERRWKSAFLWAAVATLVIGMYFAGYERPTHQPSPMPNFRNDPVSSIRFAFNFAGAAAAFFGQKASLYVAPVAGGLLLFVTAWLTIFKLKRISPTLIAMICFVFLICASAAFSRAPYGAETALSSRYTVYSGLLIALCYSAMVEACSITSLRGLPQWLAVAAILFFSRGVHAAWKGGRNFERTQTTSVMEWRNDRSGLWFYDQNRAAQILDKLVEQDLYKPPVIPPALAGAAPLHRGDEMLMSDVKIRLRTLNIHDDVIEIAGETNVTRINAPGSKIYGVLKTTEGNRRYYRAHEREVNHHTTVFQITVRNAVMPGEVEKVGVHVVNEDNRIRGSMPVYFPLSQ